MEKRFENEFKYDSLNYWPLGSETWYRDWKLEEKRVLHCHDLRRVSFTKQMWNRTVHVRRWMQRTRTNRMRATFSSLSYLQFLLTFFCKLRRHRSVYIEACARHPSISDAVSLLLFLLKNLSPTKLTVFSNKTCCRLNEQEKVVRRRCTAIVLLWSALAKGKNWKAVAGYKWSHRDRRKFFYSRLYVYTSENMLSSSLRIECKVNLSCWEKFSIIVNG